MEATDVLLAERRVIERVLVANGMARESGPVAIMLAQHEKFLNLASELERSVSAV